MDPVRQIVMTTTEELFLPSRVILRVFDRERLSAKLRTLRCMNFDQDQGRWTWEYLAEAKKLAWPAAYDALAPERQPLVLASCYSIEPDLLHIYLRSTLRLRQFLVFFDKHFPRSWAKGEFFDEYNLITRLEPGQPMPRPEDYFRDDSTLAFFDLETELADPATAAARLMQETQRYLQPLQRHSLEAFYEDGEEHLLGAMRLREILAMKQDQSPHPIRPFDVIMEAMETSSQAAEPGDGNSVPPVSSLPAPTGAQAESQSVSRQSTRVLSCLHLDRSLNRMVLDFGSACERYLADVSCCDNPVCRCEILDLWLQLLSGSVPGGRITHLRLSFDRRKVDCADPKRSEDRLLAAKLAARLTPEDWLQARKIYLGDKADDSEPVDGSGLELAFPQDVLRDPSLLVQYQQVFPYARFAWFKAAGRDWTVSESYCTNPSCGCQDVILDVALAPGNTPAKEPHVVTEGDVTGFVYNYRSGQMKIEKAGPPGAPPARELFRALQRTDPDLATRLERRHRVLRQVHGRASQRAPAQTVPPAVRARDKVGRNDPCPCGSGKKFKRCCGC